MRKSDQALKNEYINSGKYANENAMIEDKSKT